MTSTQILALPIQANSRLLKASDNGFFYAIESGESGLGASVLNSIPSSAAKIIYVSKSTTATDTRTGLSNYNPDKPFSTAQAAYNAAFAAAGDHIIMLGVGDFGGIVITSDWPSRISLCGVGIKSILSGDFSIYGVGAAGSDGSGATNGGDGATGPSITASINNVMLYSGVEVLGGNGGTSGTGTGGRGGDGGNINITGYFFVDVNHIKSKGGSGGNTDSGGTGGRGGDGGTVVITGMRFTRVDGTVEIWSGGGNGGGYYDEGMELDVYTGQSGDASNVQVEDVRPMYSNFYQTPNVGGCRISSETSGASVTPSTAVAGNILVRDCSGIAWIHSFNGSTSFPDGAGNVMVYGTTMLIGDEFNGTHSIRGNIVDVGTSFVNSLEVGATLNNLGGNGGPALPQIKIETSSGDEGDNPLRWNGKIVINTADNKVKIFADGAWRQLATW